MVAKKSKQPVVPTTNDLDDWEDLAPQEFKFMKPGDCIEGILLAAKETSLGGMSYTIQVGKAMYYFFGGKQIDPLLPSKVGYEIRVEYKGKSDVSTQPGYAPMKIFDVKFRKAKPEAVADVSLTGDVPF